MVGHRHQAGRSAGGAGTDGEDSRPNRHKAKLDDLIIIIDRQPRYRRSGHVELREDAPPLIAGTLAFNSLDIASFLQAFTPLPQVLVTDIASTIDTRFLREIGLDLRLSAQSASFGPVALSNLAAAARVDQGRANFDVGDATAYGGNLIGRVALCRRNGVDGGFKHAAFGAQDEFQRAVRRHRP
jgi:AsmA protein